MANKVRSLLGGPGFYAVLALCVLAVGVGGYFLLFGEPSQTEAPAGPDTAASAPVEDLPEHEPVVETVPPEEPEEETEPVVMPEWMTRPWWRRSPMWWSCPSRGRY